jgi:hypothetical protein
MPSSWTRVGTSGIGRHISVAGGWTGFGGIHARRAVSYDASLGSRSATGGLNRSQMERTRNGYTDAEGLRKLRFVAQLQDGSRRALFKLVLTERDTSFYIVPYGIGNRYHCGVETLGVRERQKTFTFTGQLDDELKVPKLSLHRSGLVRAEMNGVEAARLQGAPFEALRGEHLATVCVHGLSGMPEETGPIRRAGRNRDLVTSIAEEVEGLRIVLRANAVERHFDGEEEYLGELPWVVPVARSGECLNIGVFIVDNSENYAGRGVATTVIGGWDVRKPPEAENTFVFLVAR